MYDGNTEVAEIRLHDGLKVLDTPLMDLGLPKGILIAAIVRGHEDDSDLGFVENREAGNF